MAAFLTRCLFSMFAEDVALLPERSFKQLLERHRDEPARLRKMLQVLWADVDRGGFSAVLERDVLRFNGKFARLRSKRPSPAAAPRRRVPCD